MNKRRRRPAPEEQLLLPLAWLTEDEFADALVARGADVRRVRFKENRSRLVSLSHDRSVLNAHACFRTASDDVLDAIADFVRAPARSPAYRNAIARMRAWWDAQAERPAPGELGWQPPPCCATDEQRRFLRDLYRRLNEERFASVLPTDVPLRLSDRMTRRFGHVQYGRANGSRRIDEIALNADLLLRGNERHLVDTLLHEMAHAEAWLVNGHRDHGRPWRAIARRVGCEPRACSTVRIRRRGKRQRPASTVPSLAP